MEHLLDLPKELILVIVGYLEPIDLMNTAVACQLLCTICMLKINWSTFTLCDECYSSDVLHLMHENCKNIINFEVNCPRGLGTTQQETLLNNLTLQMNRVLHCSLYFETLVDLSFIRNFGELRFLTTMGTEFVPTDFFIGVVSSLVKLRKLNLAGNAHLTEDIVYLMVKRMSNLRSLDVSDCQEFKPQTVRLILLSHRKLRFFDCTPIFPVRRNNLSMWINLDHLSTVKFGPGISELLEQS